MSVRRLLAEVDSAELSAWLVYLEVKQERDDDVRRTADIERRLGSD